MTLIYKAEITDVITRPELKAALLEAFSKENTKAAMIRKTEKVLKSAGCIDDAHIIDAHLFPDEEGDL